MCEQSEINYLDGEVVWVKLGSCWWPGEVVGPEKLPPDVLPSFRKPPIAVVKFFQETTYEYVKNINAIYKYNCSRKNEFINKGLYMYRTKHGHMEKFPEDVIRAETAVGGDKEILTRDEFQEVKKESYAGLFGDTKKTPASGQKGRGRGRPSESPKESFTPSRRFYKDKNDYKVHILVQPSKESTSQPTDTASTPSTSRAGSEVAEDKQEKPQKPEPLTPTVTTPTASSAGTYACPTCSFTTTRLNVLVLHNKTHSVTFTPYTPSPVRKKPSPKQSPKCTNKTPKTPRPRKEKTEKAAKKPTQSKKRTAEDKPQVEVKKPKTDQEIKSSLLADWDDDAEDESNDESTSMIASGSPEVPARSESPAVPTTADLPGGETSREHSSPEKKSDEIAGEKPECSSDSKYEFCEDEDWPVEADGGRKIPRVKNPSKRKEDTKSLSLDEDEVAKEVAELLNKTALPELPSVPEPLKVEENFPEPSVVKSPDKKPDTTLEPNKASEKAIETKPTIFKTKTFFRSRHSRSQDAIGKYVAEQLNAERIDILESDINGSEAVSSPEARESPPVDHVKVARLAPKIQLKKMKAEAAQLREKEKTAFDKLDFIDGWKSENTEFHLDSMDIPPPSKVAQDVIYPTQEIKPINKDSVKPLHIDTDHIITEKNITNTLDENEKQCELLNTDDMNNEIENRILNKTIKSSSEFSNEVLECPNIQSGVSENSPKLASPVNNKTKTYGKHMKSPKKTEPSPQKSRESTPVLPSINNSPKSSLPEHNSHSPNTNLLVQSPKASPIKLGDKLPSPVKSTSNLQKTYEQLMEPYMTESTASAVDALLSVSRETDRVPRIVGSGPPEDLFEDDHKDFVNNEEETPDNLIENKPIEDPIIETSEELKSNPIIETSEEVNGLTEEHPANENTPMDIDVTVPDNNVDNLEKQESVSDNAPSESDLQIAETLLNLPSTAIQSAPNEQLENVVIPMSVDSQQIEEVITESVVENEVVENTSSDMTPDLLQNNNKNLGIRFETEQEKSENLNAAQSLVEMSESMDHKMNLLENKPINNDVAKSSFNKNQNNGLDTIKCSEQQNVISKENKIDPVSKISQFDSSSSKLLKILEEPTTPKPLSSKTTPVKQLVSTKKVIVTGKEKILNFDVASSTFKNKQQAPKQKIIIRRTGSAKSFINNLSDVVPSPDKIILSRTNVAAQDGSSVHTFTIQASPDVTTASDAKQIIIQPKLRKVAKPPTTKVQKLKPSNSLVQWSDTKTSTETSLQEEPMFDINSMPVVLSDDILTPESIEKMPIVMSDGNILTNTPPQNPPKLIKTSKPTIVENEKVQISPSPSKPEMKTLLMNATSDVNKVTTPNILSKSAKLRGAKPMLVIDKTTGKQKIIMTKGDPPAVKEIKPAQTLIQPVVTQTVSKTEKFLILPSGGSPRSGRTQKIVIDPQTGKAHVLVAKGQDAQISAQENKPVSAKLIPPSSDAGSPGNTVMIITNAQGGQSRIVLTPEHEKILFPNKQQPNMSQLKTITHRITPASVAQKTIVAPASPVKTPAKIVPKQQKGAIITSKGQLIVGGRVATTAQNIAPLPEIRPAPKTELRAIPKRVIASESKKLVHTIQKNSSEPLILLQQKSGAVMQLTAAQFEHLQRTGQIIQKTPSPPIENKIVVQKSITISPKDTTPAVVQKQQRVRKAAAASPTPTKRLKQQPMLAPALAPSIAPMPPLTSISHSVSTVTPSLPSIVPSVSETVSITTTGGYPELENFEELLPTSSIVRQQPEHTMVTHLSQPDPHIVQPEPVTEPPPAQLSDGQLLAVPGENFGGPPGSFYLCVEDNGTLTPIDNRPLVLENNQLVPMAIESLPVFAPQPERRDILEAALANSDVFHADAARDEAPDFRDLNANVSVHCRVSETSTTLNQPIMTPVEVPTKADTEPAVPSNLEDGLAVIGVTPHTVPTSLELPITVTDPRIAPKMTDPLSNSNYGTALLASPNTDMSFVTSEETETGAAISMPLLTDEEAVGKSMPILTDEGAERTESSSLESLEARDADDAWPRRLLTPATDGSDVSETSAEIPLQPHIQLSVDDLQRAS